MMDWTDVHYRQLARIMSKHTWLYTEMVVDSTLNHNPDHDRFLWFPPEQRPIVCQLGGSNPESLAKAAKSVAKYGYDEINLNCGCPSDKVAGAGCFGASLMLRPELVAQCCAAMAEAVHPVPITVKCRIGVDDVDSYAALSYFIETVSSQSPVTHFVIHARKCLLKGLNPHQNRTVPPLRYEWIWALRRDFPGLEFSLNGGVVSLEEAGTVLGYPISITETTTTTRDNENDEYDNVTTPPPPPTIITDNTVIPQLLGNNTKGGGGLSGVMIGRAAYHTPWHLLGDADRYIFGADSNPTSSRRQVLEEYTKYADAMVGRYCVKPDGHKVPSVRTMVKPLLGMFAGEPRGKKWRAAVDVALKTAESVSEVMEKTLWVLKPETLDAPPKMVVGGAAELHYLAPDLPVAVTASGDDKKGEKRGSEEKREEEFALVKECLQL
jgi:tRNA-dihydrouridine synthase A